MVDSLQGGERSKLIQQLHERYTGSSGGWRRFTYLRKKYSWLLIVEGSKKIKRGIDVIGGMSLLILLFPLMFVVGFLIKVTDGGPVLYISNRVGKWGKEFRFPKFRSMRIHADRELKQMRSSSDHKDSITFKMKRDPRVSWIGRIIRKFSIDELPQLWCVVKGDMTLVGPRPPLPVEVAQYNLAERRRLDITPGLTGLWQVSGRSNLPFNKQLKLDVEYIQSQSLWMDLKILLKTIPAVILGRGAY